MKLFIVALLMALLAGSFAGEISGYFQDSEYPGTCVYDDLLVWPDDMGHPNNGKCERVYCLNEQGFAKVLSCNVQRIPAGCKLGEAVKPNTVYPECCEKHIICD